MQGPEALKPSKWFCWKVVVESMNLVHLDLLQHVSKRVRMKARLRCSSISSVDDELRPQVAATRLVSLSTKKHYPTYDWHEAPSYALDYEEIRMMGMRKDTSSRAILKDIHHRQGQNEAEERALVRRMVNLKDGKIIRNAHEFDVDFPHRELILQTSSWM